MPPKTWKEDFMSRIGLKLMGVFLAGLVATVAIVNTILLVLSSQNLKNVVEDQNLSSIRTVQGEFTAEIMDLRRILKTLDSIGFTTEGNTENTGIFWQMLQQSSSEFLALYNSSGTVFFSTDNYDLADFDLNMALSTGWMGFVKDSKADITVQVCIPVERDGKKVGAAVAGMHLNDSTWLDSIKEQTNAEITLFSGNTRIATTVTDENNQRAVGTTMADNIANAVLQKGEEYQGEADLFGQNHYVAYEPMPDIYGNIIGAYFSGTSSANTDAMRTRTIIISIIVAVVMAGIMIFVILIVNNNILIKPVKEANKLAEDMSRGLLREPSSNFRFGNDELGDFVRKLDSTKGELNSYIEDINYVLSEMADGNFTAHPRVEYQGDFTEIKVSFDKIESALSNIIGKIGASSRDVKSGSAQIASGSQMLADGTTQQAAATEQLSASINDIADKVQQSAQNAAEASRISTETSEKITHQNNEVKNMLGAMDEIKQKSDQIQNIIEAIDDIAFQTNILALNAAIEAARAGEAGKGFAVVADEVRNLAAKSAQSAQQTGDLINATIEAVNKGTVIAESTAETMKQVTDLADQTNMYISDITTATQEQAESIKQVKIGIDRIAQVVQQNSATAEQTAASCQDLSNQSAALEDQIGRFRV